MTAEFAQDLDRQLAILFAFAREVNELDLAASLGGEFRGMRDPNWISIQTASEVHDELLAICENKPSLSKPAFRDVLFRYSQLAEAGGFYETLQNIFGIIEGRPYNLWPFHDLVKTKRIPAKVIGPNANAVFRKLATTANNVGMTRLSQLLERAFRDDIRNAIAHADYVIAHDGLHLTNRNGGYPKRLTFEEFNSALNVGMWTYQLLSNWIDATVRSFHPSRSVIGRMSACPPMTWTVKFDQETGAFSMTSESSGVVSDTHLTRKDRIAELLNGRIVRLFAIEGFQKAGELIEAFEEAGIEVPAIALSHARWNHLISEICSKELWDQRLSCHPVDCMGLTPWGFRYLGSREEVDLLFSSAAPLHDSNADLTP